MEVRRVREGVRDALPADIITDASPEPVIITALGRCRVLSGDQIVFNSGVRVTALATGGAVAWLRGDLVTPIHLEAVFGDLIFFGAPPRLCGL